MSPVVEQPAKARLITDAPHDKTVPVTLHYDGADPLAVRIVFPPEVSLDNGEVIWAFARELLESGMRAPSGQGDVRVWPCGRAHLMLELRSPEGVAVVQLDTAPMRRFLNSCYGMVPEGEERQDIAVDRGLDKLLRNP
jgi:hypothetical protein